jgi:aspartyl protease family protein
LKALAAALLLLPLVAAAQSVQLAGRMGAKALLVIDGQTQLLAPGDSARGVKLLRLDDAGAVVEVGGRSQTLAAGGAAVRVGAGAPAAGGAREVVIPVGPGGHFTVGGAINGRAVRFMVDTGATMVALSQDEADRLGLDYRRGERGVSQTANGNVVVWVTTLSSLRVGEVELANVRAVVVPAAMPGILLGNSALGRFSMQRDSDVMRLTLR